MLHCQSRPPVEQDTNVGIHTKPQHEYFSTDFRLSAWESSATALSCSVLQNVNNGDPSEWSFPTAFSKPSWDDDDDDDDENDDDDDDDGSSHTDESDFDGTHGSAAAELCAAIATNNIDDMLETSTDRSDLNHIEQSLETLPPQDKSCRRVQFVACLVTQVSYIERCEPKDWTKLYYSRHELQRIADEIRNGSTNEEEA